MTGEANVIASRSRPSPYSVGRGISHANPDKMKQAVGSDLMSRLKRKSTKGRGLMVAT
jgi:hypothetical protein